MQLHWCTWPVCSLPLPAAPEYATSCPAGKTRCPRMSSRQPCWLYLFFLVPASCVYLCSKRRDPPLSSCSFQRIPGHSCLRLQLRECSSQRRKTTADYEHPRERRPGRHGRQSRTGLGPGGGASPGRTHACTWVSKQL